MLSLLMLFLPLLSFSGLRHNVFRVVINQFLFVFWYWCARSAGGIVAPHLEYLEFSKGVSYL